jgi:hypothetical protein
MGADARGAPLVALVTGANHGIGFGMRLVNTVCPGLAATSPEAEAAGGHPLPARAASMMWATTLPDGESLAW